MAVTIDENGVTIVGNKVMLSGKTTPGPSTVADMSPYMKVIEQVIFSPQDQGDPLQFRNNADNAWLDINGRQLTERLSETTFRFFTSGGVADGLRANTDVAGTFIVIGRK